MSDEDRDVDVESDAEKRAHHNALERKRRDHIKESFHSLRDSVPTLQGEKVKSASRAQILKQATDYIQFMTKKNSAHQQDIDDLKKQNNVLEQQVNTVTRRQGKPPMGISGDSVRALEKAKAAGTFAAQAMDSSNLKVGGYGHGSGSESSDSEAEPPSNRRKKIKT